MARKTGSNGVRTEAAIREAAIRLIARLGYEALSMRRLAEEIGLGAAALYRYFPNKQSILMSIMRTHMIDMLEAWSALTPSGLAPAKLETFVRFHIRFHWPRIDSLFVSYMELRALTPQHFREIEDLRNRYERIVSTILEDGLSRGNFAPMDPRVTARAIIALLNGLTTWYRADGPISQTEIENIYCDMVARVVGAPPDASSASEADSFERRKTASVTGLQEGVWSS